MTNGTGLPIGVVRTRLLVRVTEHDIEWAVRDDSSRCMVARALAREVDDASRVEVDTQTIRFTTTKGRFAYLTPLAVQRYVAAFDAGEPIEPFEFTLRSGLRIKQRLMSPEEKADNRLRVLTEDRKKDPLLPRNRATKYTTEGDIGSPPRVFKTRRRTYGHRLLRINQPMQATGLDERQPVGVVLP